MLAKTKVKPTPAALDPSLVRSPAAATVPVSVAPPPVETEVRKTCGDHVEKRAHKKQYLELGSGFRLAHRPGTTYSLFYRLLAEKGHFSASAALMDSDDFNPNDPVQAKRLLDRMIVPVRDLEAAFAASPERIEYAKRKTKKLWQRAKSGEAHAKQMLKKGDRLQNGRWTGNLSEIIPMCLGYYRSLISTMPGKQPRINNNGRRFQEAGIVIRRFPLLNGESLMMFPQKHIDMVKTAILTVHSLNEDA